MLDGGDDIELASIADNIAEAQVIALYFPLLRKTLLVDTRTGPASGPLVCVVEMANTTQERVRSLRRMRPQFPRPDSITMIPWLRRVETLDAMGVWAQIEGRLAACGGAEALDAAAGCLEELRAYQRREFRRVITGEHYQTLWGRSGLGDAAPR